MPDTHREVSGSVHLWDFSGASPWHQTWARASRATETFVGARESLCPELQGQGPFALLVKPQMFLRGEGLGYSKRTVGLLERGQRYPRPLPLYPHSIPEQRLCLGACPYLAQSQGAWEPQGRRFPDLLNCLAQCLSTADPGPATRRLCELPCPWPEVP